MVLGLISIPTIVLGELYLSRGVPKGGEMYVVGQWAQGAFLVVFVAVFDQYCLRGRGRDEKKVREVERQR